MYSNIYSNEKNVNTNTNTLNSINSPIDNNNDNKNDEENLLESLVDRSQDKFKLISPNSKSTLCPSCVKSMSFFSRKRLCNNCNIIYCKQCTSKKIVVGQIICKICNMKMNNNNSIFDNNNNNNNESELINSNNEINDKLDNQELEEMHIKLNNNGYYACLNVKIFEAKGIPAGDLNLMGEKVSSDPYCVLTTSEDLIERNTSIIKNTLFPIFNEEFEIPLRAPCQSLKIEIYDRDELSNDDLMGYVIINLKLLPNNYTISGWLPIIHYEPVDISDLDLSINNKNNNNNNNKSIKPIKPAGGIHLSLRMDYKSKNELNAYIRHAVSKPPYIQPKFDLNEAYGPLMIIIDIIWWRTLSPIIFMILDILFWKNMFISLIWFILFPIICLYLKYWPSFICFLFAISMIWNKSISSFSALSYKNSALDVDNINISLIPSLDKKNNKTNNKTVTMKLLENAGLKKKVNNNQKINDELTINKNLNNKKVTDFEDQNLSSVIILIASILPKWLKDIIAGLQPTLRNLSNILILITDIYRGDNSFSYILCIIFIILGIILYYIPFSYFICIITIVLFIICSPLMFLVIGIISYFIKPKPIYDPLFYGIVKEFNKKWLSEDAADIVNKHTTRLKRSNTFNFSPNNKKTE